MLRSTLILFLVIPGLSSARSLIRDEGFVTTQPKPTPVPTPVICLPPVDATGALTLLDVRNTGTVEKSDESSGGGAAGAGGPGGLECDPRSGKKDGSVRSLLEESKKRPILVINIAAERAVVYRDGKVAHVAWCRVGEKEHPEYVGTGKSSKTRVGEYKVKSWHEKYSNKTYAPWTGEIFSWDMLEKHVGAFGAHTAKLNDSAAQWVHGTYGNGFVDWLMINTRLVPGSHGCVRFENSDIATIRELCPIGSKVIRIYTTRHGGSEYPNRYAYEDVVDNGSFEPDSGELVGYRHPRDAKGSN